MSRKTHYRCFRASKKSVVAGRWGSWNRDVVTVMDFLEVSLVWSGSMRSNKNKAGGPSASCGLQFPALLYLKSFLLDSHRTSGSSHHFWCLGGLSAVWPYCRATVTFPIVSITFLKTLCVQVCTLCVTIRCMLCWGQRTTSGIGPYFTHCLP